MQTQLSQHGFEDESQQESEQSGAPAHGQGFKSGAESPTVLIRLMISGLRSFSVSGRVAKPGVHLAPAGISLTELIEEYCGGMAAGHRLLAYLPGGASGGILPASKADIPLDFDTLQEHGCFIGSAAVIVLSDQDDLPAAATNLLGFFADESCGQCPPCRVGTEKMLRLLERDTWDEETLQQLAGVMADASICGLGQAAPNPVLSLLRDFRSELVSQNLIAKG